mmetsp:Transcript_18820/g.61478  ORF Transcript_18820/g.61478 Transcript_18820/m.61478 type:complete len:208 (-) Transcript_18820:210-833(-)
MHELSARRERLMAAPSADRIVRASVACARSLPARSIRESLATRSWPGRSTSTWRTACEREDVALQRVGSVVRLRFPWTRSDITSSALLTSTWLRPATHTPMRRSSRSCSERGVRGVSPAVADACAASRSRIVSLYTSRYDSRARPPSASSRSKRSRSASTITPGAEDVPVIVCVLPAPVAPYAKTHALCPSYTDLTSGAALAAYTSS